MLTLKELIAQVEQLNTSDKWQLVKQVLNTLEQQTGKDSTEYHQFLRETYGSLRETPIQRWPQGEYEDRELLA